MKSWFSFLLVDGRIRTHVSKNNYGFGFWRPNRLRIRIRLRSRTLYFSSPRWNSTNLLGILHLLQNNVSKNWSELRRCGLKTLSWRDNQNYGSLDNGRSDTKICTYVGRPFSEPSSKISAEESTGIPEDWFAAPAPRLSFSVSHSLPLLAL